ncbi:hypothetical protein ACJX0J_024862, partial [Zea mays]
LIEVLSEFGGIKYVDMMMKNCVLFIEAKSKLALGLFGQMTKGNLSVLFKRVTKGPNRALMFLGQKTTSVLWTDNWKIYGYGPA